MNSSSTTLTAGVAILNGELELLEMWCSELVLNWRGRREGLAGLLMILNRLARGRDAPIDFVAVVETLASKDLLTANI